MPEAILPYLAGACFSSFCWGMFGHFRRTSPPSPIMIAVGLLLVPFVAVQLVALATRAPWLPWLALLLYLLSFCLFWWAVSVTRGKLAPCGQGLSPRKLVTEPPYSYIRHPFYTSYNLAGIAGFVATGWWPLLVLSLFMIAVYEGAARQEERGFLSGSLSEEYLDYMRRAGKYFPRVWRRTPIPLKSGSTEV